MSFKSTSMTTLINILDVNANSYRRKNGYGRVCSTRLQVGQPSWSIYVIILSFCLFVFPTGFGGRLFQYSKFRYFLQL
ncbi:hypothetical protein KEJ23_01820, partial [Candidatus Bathyarchaeota archaeon]|nr:hypothetical protein [Candidatus Bathyarchaeota archaeon]